MKSFVAALVADLRAFCGDLLEAGLAPSTGLAQDARSPGTATFSTVLRHVDAFTTSVPRLIDSLDAGESQIHHEITARRTPLGATMSRSPSAWECVGGRLLPRFWEQVRPLLEPDVRPLGYTRFVLDCLASTFGSVRSRLRRHIVDATVARQGTSRFAKEDLEELKALDARLDRADALLSRCSQAMHKATAGRVRATDRLPHPFPRAPAWAAFRRLADSILRPEQFLPDTISDFLREDPHLADVPFLYQRWVGVRVVRELADTFGFKVLGDPTGPLFLGGCIPMRRGSTVIELWSEPRLSQHEHPSGLSADGAEATPDFLLITPGRGGPDAFVLDATMSQDPTIMERKTRYRERVAFRQFRPQAGVPGRHRPLRAWAAAPLAGATHNQLTRPDGSAGVVPMQPGSFVPGPLRNWLAEIVDHGDAWQLLTDARASDTNAPATSPRPSGDGSGSERSLGVKALE